MDLQKLIVKFYVDNADGVRLDEFIPVFHRWIRERRLEGILIDVADYGHLPDSPGVVLVGHEADYYMDLAEGPLGLLYSRKAALSGSGPERVLAAFRGALKACRALEQEFQDRLKFRGEAARFIINDRLIAPNEAATFDACRADLEAASARLYAGAKVALAQDTTDPRRRFTVHLSSSEPVDVTTLLARVR